MPNAIARKYMMQEVMQLVNLRWDDMVRNDLHAAAHLLSLDHSKEKDCGGRNVGRKELEWQRR